MLGLYLVLILLSQKPPFLGSLEQRQEVLNHPDDEEVDNHYGCCYTKSHFQIVHIFYNRTNLKNVRQQITSQTIGGHAYLILLRWFGMVAEIFHSIWYRSADETIVVDVDGYEPLARFARKVHNSNISPIEVCHNLLDVLCTFVDSVKGLLAMTTVAYIFGELYRRGVEIQPTKFASAQGTGAAVGSVSPT